MGTLRGWVSQLRGSMGADPRAGAPVPGPEGVGGNSGRPDYAPSASPVGGSDSDMMMPGPGAGNDPPLPNGDLSGLQTREQLERMDQASPTGGSGGYDGMRGPIQLAQVGTTMGEIARAKEVWDKAGATAASSAPIKNTSVSGAGAGVPESVRARFNGVNVQRQPDTQVTSDEALRRFMGR